MKMLLGAALGTLAMLVLMIGAQNAYAKTEISAFVSGFNYGVQDADTPLNAIHGFPPGPLYNGPYINQTGKGFEHHSDSFIEGYLRGWCEVMGKNARLYPHADDKVAPDFRCSDVLGMSITFTH
jgi:hypothetical protein